MRISRSLVALAAAATVLPLAVLHAPAADAARREHRGPVVVVRGAADRTVSFATRRAGESLLDLTVSAPQADWATKGSESAVVSLSVDGRYQSDLVISSANPTARELAARVRCPVLVVHGSEDAIISSAVGRELAAATGGELVLIEGGGHFVHGRDPVKVNLLLRDFLRRIAS